MTIVTPYAKKKAIQPHEHYYNVLTLHGDKSKLDTIVERYLNPDHQPTEYLFDIQSNYVGAVTTESEADIKQYRDNATAFIENLRAAFDTDVVETLQIDSVQYVIRRLTEMNHRFNEQNVKQPSLMDDLFTLRNQHSDNHLLLLSRDKMFALVEQLVPYHTSVTEHDFQYVLSEDTLYDDDDEPAFWMSYIPLSAEDLENEDQSYNRIDDETLVVGIPTKVGVIYDVALSLVNTYNVDATILFGNGDIRGKLTFNGDRVELSEKEPTLEEVISYLDNIGQLDNYAYKYGWEEHHLYPDEDDEAFLANTPALGVQ